MNLWIFFFFTFFTFYNYFYLIDCPFKKLFCSYSRDYLRSSYSEIKCAVNNFLPDEMFYRNKQRYL